MYFLIGVIILILFILGTYIYIKLKLRKIFGNISIKNVVKEARILDKNTPKSVGSLDSIYLNKLLKDFPSININEIKRMAEEEILKYLKAIEDKSVSNIKSEKVKLLVESKINDLGNTKISYSNIKFHNTVLNKYENSNGIATITIALSLEYDSLDKSELKKIQDRYRVEYIYIVDATKVSKDKRAFSIKCPNCGSSNISQDNKRCSYCGSSLIDIVKRAWVINNIIKY